MDISKITRNAEGKVGQIGLIRAEFDGVKMLEMKSLTDEDRLDLASAIAVHNNVPDADLSFVPNSYR